MSVTYRHFEAPKGKAIHEFGCVSVGFGTLFTLLVEMAKKVSHSVLFLLEIGRNRTQIPVTNTVTRILSRALDQKR